MKLTNSGLILEGGGQRGIYTAGVLRLLTDHGIQFPYVIGVSMGACNAANYVSGQRERNRIVTTRFVNDKRHMSYLRFFLKGELFGMDFLFDDIPNHLVPFDTESFIKSNKKFVLAVTDCDTGDACYFNHHASGENFLTLLRASCSLPFAAPVVRYNGKCFMDGGIADSIPLKKSMADGNQKHLLILTQPKGYRKKSSIWTRLIRYRYPQYKGLCNAFETRSKRYNELACEIDALEEGGKIFVIRPSRPLYVKRTERNLKKLYRTYDQGYYDAMEKIKLLKKYLST